MFIDKHRSSDLFEYEELIKLLKSKGDKYLSALDVGSGIPMYLFDLHYKYGFKYLKGVELISTEKDIIDRYSFFINPDDFKDLTTLQQCHENFINDFGEREKVSREKLDSLINDFGSAFEFLTNYDITLKDNSLLGKFDVVFLVDILHFITFSDVLRILPVFTSLLKKDGLILIRVNHVENISVTNPVNSNKIGKRSYKSKFKDEIIHLFDESGFEKIINLVENDDIVRLIPPERNLYKDISKIKSMTYFGIKK